MRIQIPIPTMAMPLAVAAIAPWIRWSKRFSLRTALITTTLIALALGLVVYAVRNLLYPTT
jgi:hypothetical protein